MFRRVFPRLLRRNVDTTPRRRQFATGAGADGAGGGGGWLGRLVLLTGAAVGVGAAYVYFTPEDDLPAQLRAVKQQVMPSSVAAPKLSSSSSSSLPSRAASARVDNDNDTVDVRQADESVADAVAAVEAAADEAAVAAKEDATAATVAAAEKVQAMAEELNAAAAVAANDAEEEEAEAEAASEAVINETKEEAEEEAEEEAAEKEETAAAPTEQAADEAAVQASEPAADKAPAQAADEAAAAQAAPLPTGATAYESMDEALVAIQRQLQAEYEQKLRQLALQASEQLTEHYEARMRMLTALEASVKAAEATAAEAARAQREQAAVLRMCAAVLRLQAPLLRQQSFRGALDDVRAAVDTASDGATDDADDTTQCALTIQRDFVQRVLARFPAAAVHDGVPTLFQLQRELHDLARRATRAEQSLLGSIVDATAGGGESAAAHAHAATAYRAGATPSATLSRASWHLSRDALAASIGELETLAASANANAELRQGVNAWLSAARRRHSAEQVVKALAAECERFSIETEEVD